MLAVTGQPTGSHVYAIIEAAGGTVYQSGSLSAFTTQASAAYVLAESPTGSERYRAAVPTLPSGVYTVTYFLREGTTPATTDRPLGAEDISVGASSLYIVLDPVYNTPPDPLYTNGEIQVSQHEAGSIGVPVFDASGPVTLPASPTFLVYRDTFPQPQVIFQVTATTSGNTATISYNTSQTATSGRFRYQLEAGDGTILATGLFVIRPTV